MVVKTGDREGVSSPPLDVAFATCGSPIGSSPKPPALPVVPFQFGRPNRGERGNTGHWVMPATGLGKKPHVGPEC